MESSTLSSIKSILPLNYNPQSNEFFFEQDKITFNSKFDSGNLYDAQRTQAFTVIKILIKD
jgi:hypothetical protein